MRKSLVCTDAPQLGQRLPECKLEEEEVLLLLERVNEAQRLATREVKEQLATREGGRKSRKKGRHGDDDGDSESAIRGEMTRGFYAGGSGGNGGGYHNQRGGTKKGGRGRGGRGGRR